MDLLKTININNEVLLWSKKHEVGRQKIEAKNIPS